MHNSGININIGSPHGIRPGGCCGPRHGHGAQGMMRMMQMMMQLMSQMMGGGGAHQGGCCCPQQHPNFGHGGQRPGIHINLGASIGGFLGR